MNTHPRISIVTVVLNGADVIAKTIESLRQQTFRDFEYIVVDGGSVDGTAEILQKYDGFISKTVCESDRGIADAFNKGIGLCTGEIVGLLNAGDWYEPTALQEVSTHFDKPHCDVFVAGMRYHGNENVTYEVYPNPERISSYMSVPHPATFIRREVYDKHGVFDETLRVAMDYDLLLRLHSKGVRFVRSNSLLVNMAGGGVSSSRAMQAQWEVLRIKNQRFGRKRSHYLRFAFMAGALFGVETLRTMGLSQLLRPLRRQYARILKSRQQPDTDSQNGLI